MKPLKVNFVKLLMKYKSGWVGISQDFASVLVSGKTLKEARKKAVHINEKIYFFPAGEKYSNFIGLFSA